MAVFIIFTLFKKDLLYINYFKVKKKVKFPKEKSVREPGLSP